MTSSLVAARGMARSLNSNFGFEPRNALLLNTNLAMGGYQGEAAAAMQQRMAEEAAAIPGVTAVGWIDRVPLTGNTISTSVYTDDTGEPTPSNAVASPLMYSISTDYLRAAGTALLAGRSFTQHDVKGAPRVAIVNQSFAKKVFGAEGNALGRYFKRRSGPRFEVVGIVEEGKHKSLTEDAQPVMFVPIAQVPTSDTWLVTRSSQDAEQIAAKLRRGAASGCGLPVYIEPWWKRWTSRCSVAGGDGGAGVLGAMGAMLAITGISEWRRTR